MSLMTTSSAFSATLLPFRPRPRLSLARLRLHPRRRALFRCAAVSEIAPAASAAYGVLLLGGGAFAYARSGSKGSIYGGLAGAALMGAAYYLMQSPETMAAGDAVGFGSAFLFACVFGIRLYNSRKLVPSGLLLALSLGALGVFYSAYFARQGVNQFDLVAEEYVASEASFKACSVGL